jgi:hypothetical protein
VKFDFAGDYQATPINFKINSVIELAEYDKRYICCCCCGQQFINVNVFNDNSILKVEQLFLKFELKEYIEKYISPEEDFWIKAVNLFVVIKLAEYLTKSNFTQRYIDERPSDIIMNTE